MNTHRRAFIVVAGAVACFVIVFLMSLSSYSSLTDTTSQRNTMQQLAREWFTIKKFTIDFSRTPDDITIIRIWRSSRERFGSLLRKIDTSSMSFRLNEDEDGEDRIGGLTKRWEAISLTLDELDRISEDETDEKFRGAIGRTRVQTDPRDHIRYLMEEFYADAAVFEDWIDEAIRWFDTYAFNQMRAIEYLFVGFLVIVTAVLLLVLNTTRIFTTGLDRLTWALESLGEGCLITDSSSRIVFVNRSARTMLRIGEHDTVKGMHLGQFLNPAPAGDPSSSYLIGRPASGMDGSGPEDTFITIRDGRMLRTTVLKPEPESDGKNTFVYGLTDISPVVRLQEELDRRKDLDNYGSSVSSIAHALNNSFMGILGNIELAILSSDSASREAGYLKESKQSVMKSRDLVARLMNLTGRDGSSKKTVPLRGIMEQAAASSEYANRLRFDMRKADGNEIYALANEQKIREALNLVLKNTGENMEPGGGITVEFSMGPTDRTAKRFCCLVIRYRGYAFTSESPYGTSGSSRSNGTSPRGMDLTVAAAIIESQNGILQAQMEKPMEARITVMLPAAELTGSVERNRKRTAERRYRLLLLEDEKFVRDIGEKMLSQLGHSVTGVSTGEEALTAFRKAILECKPFDAVILDLSIPEGMDGTETFMEMRKLDPGIQAFITSGYTEDPVLSRFEDFGFTGALPKPYDMAGLSEMLAGMKPPVSSGKT